MRDRRQIRAVRRALSRGFSLLELMVVVTVIALIAVIATPSFSVARNDRIAFNYSREFQQVIHKARARAAGRGAAHLVLIGPGAGAGRGLAYVFEALDGNPGGVGNPPGPNPVSSCKGPLQWVDAVNYTPPNNTSPNARLVDWVNMNGTGVEADMDLRATLRVYNATVGAIALCSTPTGTTYVGKGGDFATAVADMLVQVPFNDVVEIELQRHRSGVPVGLKRKVLVAGEGAPRVKSE